MAGKVAFTNAITMGRVAGITIGCEVPRAQ
jgi:hypothetical protein